MWLFDSVIFVKLDFKTIKLKKIIDGDKHDGISCILLV